MREAALNGKFITNSMLNTEIFSDFCSQTYYLYAELSNARNSCACTVRSGSQIRMVAVAFLSASLSDVALTQYAYCPIPTQFTWRKVNLYTTPTRFGRRRESDRDINIYQLRWCSLIASRIEFLSLWLGYISEEAQVVSVTCSVLVEASLWICNIEFVLSDHLLTSWL